ncbi:MAG: DNA adenine methylase, partial [Tepidiformaceae bacterium]
ELRVAPFEEACAPAAPGDFVYLDPPYFPLSPTAHFTAYTRGAFGPADQERLRDVFDDLTARGIAAVLSNSCHPFIAKLYRDRGHELAEVPMSRAINSVPGKRTPIPELLVSNLGHPAVREVFT